MQRFFVVPVLAVAACTSAFAQVEVRDPWVRATVAAQKSSGAYMQLDSAQDMRLVSVRTPVAGIAELHEMTMVGNVMRMRAVPGIDIPAGKGAELKPGGHHVMLMDLKQQLRDGEIVPITLVVEGRDRKRLTIEVKARVRPLQTPAAGFSSKSHGMNH